MNQQYAICTNFNSVKVALNSARSLLNISATKTAKTEPKTALIRKIRRY